MPPGWMWFLLPSYNSSWSVGRSWLAIWKKLQLGHDQIHHLNEIREQKVTVCDLVPRRHRILQVLAIARNISARKVSRQNMWVPESNCQSSHTGAWQHCKSHTRWKQKWEKNNFLSLPAPSNGWCLNPKGLLNGTLSHPFGTPWRVQVGFFHCLGLKGLKGSQITIPKRPQRIARSPENRRKDELILGQKFWTLRKISAVVKLDHETPQKKSGFMIIWKYFTTRGFLSLLEIWGIFLFLEFLKSHQNLRSTSNNPPSPMACSAARKASPGSSSGEGNVGGLILGGSSSSQKKGSNLQG